MKKIVKYLSEDNFEFYTEKECIKYEIILNKAKNIFINYPEIIDISSFSMG